jgi:hypothetical protein
MSNNAQTENQNVQNSTTNKLIMFFGLVSTILAGLFTFYQYTESQTDSYDEMRYIEAEKTYQKMLSMTSVMSHQFINFQGRKVNVKEFRKQVQELHDFMSSDFALYRGKGIYFPLHQLFQAYINCLKHLDEKGKITDDSKCSSSKINGDQYYLSLCARQSLDAIRSKPFSIDTPDNVYSTKRNCFK